MKDDVHDRNSSATRVGNEDVERLARRAIDVLAAGHKSKPSALDHASLVSLCDTFIAPNTDAFHEAVAMMRAEGISTNGIIDHIVPAIARLMGERWFADEISFADVTIGTARLQETVRALGRHNRFDDTSRQDRHRPADILMVLPRGEDHSLGLFVATDQFRRLGYKVEIVVDQHPRTVAEIVRKGRFQMVGIAISGRRTLAPARDIVEKIRTMVTRFTPIVVGGTEFAPDRTILTATGADHVSHDVHDALRACGLSAAGSVVNEKQVSSQAKGSSAALKGDER